MKAHDRDGETVASLTPCPGCGGWPTFRLDPPPIPYRGCDWSGSCENCGDEDSAPAHGSSRVECVYAWNEHAEGDGVEGAAPPERHSYRCRCNECETERADVRRDQEKDDKYDRELGQ